MAARDELRQGDAKIGLLGEPRPRRGPMAIPTAARALALTLALAVAGVRIAPAAPLERGPTEYELKMLVLVKLASFVSWPQAAFDDDEAPVVIGIVGTDPFGESLDSLVAAERVGERSVELRRFERVEDVDDCHILFVPSSLDSQALTIVDAVGDQHTLTVGESPGFIDDGGMVSLRMKKRRVTLEIDNHRARCLDLRIASQLLRLARSVDGPRPCPGDQR